MTTFLNKGRIGHFPVDLIAPKTAPELPEDTSTRHDAAPAALLRSFHQHLKAAVAQSEHVILDVSRRWHNRRARRAAIRELRITGKERLIDIGIEADRIEDTVDAMLATHRDRGGTGMNRKRKPPRHR